MKLSPDTTKTINGSAGLQSLLYDINLLPETITTERDATIVTAIACAYVMGENSGLKHNTGASE